MVEAFDENHIFQVTLKHDLQVYRSINNLYLFDDGAWWCVECFDKHYARESLAILPIWSEMGGVKTSVIPKGTTVFIGTAAKQIEGNVVYRGGQPQIYVIDSNVLRDIRLRKE